MARYLRRNRNSSIDIAAPAPRPSLARGSPTAVRTAPLATARAVTTRPVRLRGLAPPGPLPAAVEYRDARAAFLVASDAIVLAFFAAGSSTFGRIIRDKHLYRWSERP